MPLHRILCETGIVFNKQTTLWRSQAYGRARSVWKSSFPDGGLLEGFFPVIVWYTDCFVLSGQGPLSSVLFTLPSDHSWAENLKKKSPVCGQKHTDQTSISLTFFLCGHNRDSFYTF